MTRCTHERRHQVGPDYGYTGSVAGPHGDENRAAHGGITYTVECDACFARRSVNQNGWHVEYGPWGPSRAERIRAAQQALATERSKRYPLPDPIELTSETRGMSVRVTCDSEGYVTLHGAPTGEDDAITRALALCAPAWLDAACAVRLHVSRLASLESELTEARA